MLMVKFILFVIIITNSLTKNVESFNNAKLYNSLNFKSVNFTNNEDSEIIRYDGTQVWGIPFSKISNIDLDLENKFGSQLWSVEDQEYQFIVKPQYSKSIELYLKNYNVSKRIIIDDLQKIIDEERNSNDEILGNNFRKGRQKAGEIWRAYRQMDVIYDYMEKVAEEYQEICNLRIIGESVHGRPLMVLEISNGDPDNPRLWIDGTTHAREWITTTSVTYIIDQLLKNWESLPDFMTQTDWFIMPIVNPDGYEYSHRKDRLWRKNRRIHRRTCDGVDLNRNFGYKWGIGKGTSNKCSQSYRGRKPFSEPESMYTAKYILRSLSARSEVAFVTFHSFSDRIIYPWGYTRAKYSNHNEVKQIAKNAAQAIKKSTGAKYSIGRLSEFIIIGGVAIDWVKGVAGINYTFLIELRKIKDYKFVVPVRYIEPNAKDAYAIVETVARALH